MTLDLVFDYAIKILLGLLCVLVHVLIKADSVQKLAVAGNVEFSFKQYLNRDYLSVWISVLLVFVWAIIYPEIMGKVYSKYQDLVLSSFAINGFLGSFILTQFLNKSKLYVVGKIDAATNELYQLKNKE